MNAQQTTSTHYDTVHRFARHHNALSGFLDAAPLNSFNFAELGGILPQGSNAAPPISSKQSDRTMASMPSAEDMVHFQKLSNEYQPEIPVRLTLVSC